MTATVDSTAVSGRQPMPKQDPAERVRNFDEVALGYSAEEARLEAARCLACKKPKCVDGCPVGIDIPAFIQLIVDGDLAAGIAKLKETNALARRLRPGVPAGGAVRAHVRASARRASPSPSAVSSASSPTGRRSRGRRSRPGSRRPTAGASRWSAPAPPASPSPPTSPRSATPSRVYEALHEAGGVLTYGIPEFRLPKAIVAREVEYVRSLGVDLRLDYVIGKTRTIDRLLADADAVFVAAGAGLPWFLDIPGENLNGVYSANEYLTRCNLMRGYRFPAAETPLIRAASVAVFGGGNVAMDSARTALRLGADEVHIVYRRSREELPARLEEVENAEEEGIIFDYLTLPVRLIGDERGWLAEIECLRMELGEPDDSGRRRPVPVPGSEFRLRMDAVHLRHRQQPQPARADDDARARRRRPRHDRRRRGDRHDVARPRLGRRRRRHRRGHGDQRDGRRPARRALHPRDAERRRREVSGHEARRGGRRPRLRTARRAAATRMWRSRPSSPRTA